MHTGVVLAGGRSTRFGEGDKALADLAGRPMIRRVADRIAPAVDGLVVNCRQEQVDGIREALDGYDNDVRFAVDRRPDRGPMAGMRTGLRAVTSEYAFVVACDMPFVDPDLATYLFRRATGHDAAVPRPDDWFQTTQAVYRADPMAAACEAAIERGERRIVEPLFDLDYVAVGAEEIRKRASLDTFENLNTREEVAEAASRF